MRKQKRKVTWSVQPTSYKKAEVNHHELVYPRYDSLKNHGMFPHEWGDQKKVDLFEQHLSAPGTLWTVCVYLTKASYGYNTLKHPHDVLLSFYGINPGIDPTTVDPSLLAELTAIPGDVALYAGMIRVTESLGYTHISSKVCVKRPTFIIKGTKYIMNDMRCLEPIVC